MVLPGVDARATTIALLARNEDFPCNPGTIGVDIDEVFDDAHTNTSTVCVLNVMQALSEDRVALSGLDVYPMRVCW